MTCEVDLLVVKGEEEYLHLIAKAISNQVVRVCSV